MTPAAILVITACLLACPERQCEIIQVSATLHDCLWHKPRIAREVTPPGYEVADRTCRRVQ